MQNSISADYFTKVTPGVISAGGGGLSMQGLLLTNGPRVPIDSVVQLYSLPDVGNYFGTTSVEYAAAEVYFNSFDNSDIKPGSVLFAQYNESAVSGYLRGGAVGGSLTLAQLQALAADTLTITVAGVQATSGSINLSGATSFSNAATIIQAAFTTPNFGVTYDSIAKAFVFTSTATGALETVTYCTSAGSLSAELMLTQATGAVLSQGADAVAAPGTYMAGIIAMTTNFASFCTLFNPDVSGNANKLAFAAWNNTQNKKYVYAAWDDDASATTTVPAVTSLGYLLGQDAYEGTAALYDPNNTYLASLLCGVIASIDFTKLDGRVNPTYKGASGFAAIVTDETSLSNLVANGYNTYVEASTAAQVYNFLYNGQISGTFLWLDSYINQIWMNSAFQVSLMDLMTNAKSIPYNETGYNMVRSALLGDIKAALDFGAIQQGVVLSTSQIAEVNGQAGLAIDSILNTQGWYLQVLDPGANARPGRTTPACTFWYMDGGSVQQINLASKDVL